ncbi:MAG: heavy metal-responsive transcriptional regulator [Bacteriovorax sp.]|nr:heavy metal-responsive transcriptional regulator [Bacteriovorax sp.]
MEKITIGKLAELVDVNIETIRFYQREGILKEPAKRANGYRYYNEDDASQITFIKKVKELGFSLREIKELLEINTKPRTTCDLVKNKVAKKIEEMDEKINDLIQIKNSLQALSCACDLGSDEMKKVKVMDCFDSKCC